jgi:ubiquinone/menaquinone biosynthesis C-methylase UbiE
MDIKKNSRVLDVGCGPATDTIAFSECISNEGRIVGVDNDPQMVEKANLELKQRGIEKNVVYVLGDFQCLLFFNGEFDRVHAERLFQVLPKSIDMIAYFQR